MPRKVNHGVDYDEDYDYDYDADEHEIDKVQSETLQEISRPGLWDCPICTYDNEETMSSCDICGTARNRVVNPPINDEKKSVNGASIMAKSLFAPSPNCTHEKTVICQQQSDDLVEDKGQLGNNYQNFHELLKAFSSHSKIRVKIEPFRFDVPSPDDLVSKGLRSTKLASKENSDNFSSSKNPKKSVTGKNVVPKITSSSKNIDNLTASTSKGRTDSIDELLANGDKVKGLTNSVNNISLNAKSGSSENVSIDSRRGSSLAEYKPEKWMVPVQGEGSLTQLNLAIVGHVDSGKSTLSGRLLHLLGQISQKQMHKYEKDSKLQGKGSFAYAWALDESAEERERGITMTVAVAYFDTMKYHVVVLDSPGHRDFVPNMISGATQADVAILVIDASFGNFEAGMSSSGGQTREHAQLIKSFGVDQLIVAVNKMDVVKYSKDRFETVKMELGTFLRSCHFKESSISWIPLSAMENQNLVAVASDSCLNSWYKGPYLLDAIDSLQPPSRDLSKPLLMPICDVIKSSSLGQVSACGKLEAGALRSGCKVLVMPYGDVATVRSIEQQSQPCAIARAGDSVAVTLQGIDLSRVMAGGVLCHPGFPVAVATRLELKILVLDVPMPILIGSQMEFHIYHVKEAGRVVKILSLLDSKTGKVTKKAPRCLTSKQSAIIEVVLNGEVCVEEFSRCRSLGRVFLRSSGRTVAVGIVTRTIEESK